MKNNDFEMEYYEKVKSNLISEQYKVRKNILEELHQSIQKGNLESTSDLSVDFLKLIIKCSDDKVELCRERAVNILITCLNDWNISDKNLIISLIIIIHKKLGNGNSIEASEEIRLLYVKLLKILIQKQYNISPFIEEVIQILTSCINDEYPEIKRESCECAAELAKTVAEFRNHSDKIVNAVSAALNHKHYRTRVVAIHSLADIILHSRTGSVELVCGPLSQCLLDRNPHVRVAVLRTVTSWFSKLPDRYSQFHYMLPLILTELTEENEEYLNEALNSWHEIGLRYLEENETNIKDKMEFLPTKLQDYPSDVKRPNLGCRILVQNEIVKIIPALIKELEDWKVEVRIKSSELLKTIVLHAEKGIGLFIERMLPALFRICLDNELCVSKNVVKSVEIMGYFVPPNIYWNMLKPYINENCGLGHVVIFASLLKNNPKDEVSPLVSEIVSILSRSSIREMRDINSLRYVLRIISTLLDCCESILPNEHIIHDVHLILMSVIAFTKGNVQNDAMELIHRLARIASLSVSDLNKQCLPPLFERFAESCDIWESYSADLYVFIILLQTFLDDILQFVFNTLMSILQIVLNPKFDREVRFRLLCAIVELLENEESIQIKVKFVEKILPGSLKQQLIWKAGKVEEVIRATALSIVLLFLKRVKHVSIDLKSELISLVSGLCEDSYEQTRICSLEVISNLFEDDDHAPDADTFKKTLIVVSERLNDKSNVVRLKAIQTLKSLLIYFPNLNVYKDSPDPHDFEKVKQVLELIFVNVDDSNKKIQDAAIDLFKEPVIVERFKLFFTENVLQMIVNRYTDKNASAVLSKYLKI